MTVAPPGDERDQAFFEVMESHRVRAFIRVMRALPGDPRCMVCRVPFGGSGGRVMRRLGFGPSRKNPRLCSSCFDKAPEGSVPLDVGVLFADVRGFTTFAEEHDPQTTTDVLNRFYAASVDVLCRHAIIDKLVGDEVMALYIPRLLGDDALEHMVSDARELLARIPDELTVGVGLDHGTAMVGNVGSGDVKDFTAIGDVVNTAARLQAAAAGGEIVVSRRVVALVGDDVASAEPRTLTLKGKSAPVDAFVLTPT